MFYSCILSNKLGLFKETCFIIVQSFNSKWQCHTHKRLATKICIKTLNSQIHFWHYDNTYNDFIYTYDIISLSKASNHSRQSFRVIQKKIFFSVHVRHLSMYSMVLGMLFSKKRVVAKSVFLHYLMRLCQPPDGSTSPKYKLLRF